MKKLIKEWLGIDVVERNIIEIENDCLSIMDKQLDLDNAPATNSLPPDVPFVDDDIYEYVKGSCEGYKWWVIWEDGFAGPFDKEDDANAYKEVYFLDPALKVNVCKLNRYYIQERKK